MEQEVSVVPKGLRRVVAAVFGLVLSVFPAARAQEGAATEETVERKLLEILRARGVIDGKEHRELIELSDRLRADVERRNDLEASLADELDTLVARLAQDAAPVVSYRPGGGFTFRTADERFALTVGGRLTVRFTYEDFDEGHDRDDLSEFSAPNARVFLKGHVFSKFVKYVFQFNLAGDTARGRSGSTSVPNLDPGATTGSTSHSHSFASDNRLTELKDAYADLDLWGLLDGGSAGKVSPVNLRAGQFKAPFSRQQMTSSGMLEFVDRAITDRQYAKGREPGAMLYGMFGGASNDLIEWYAGVFNGEGENVLNNDPGLEVVGRLAVNLLGVMAYAEGDPKNTEDPELQAAFGILHHDDTNRRSGSATIGASPLENEFAWNAELAFRWSGLYAAFEWFDQEFGTEEVSGGDLDTDSHGFYAQAGYFVVPERLEVGFRFAEIRFEDSGADLSPAGLHRRREWLGVLGYFFEGHNLKVQMDGGLIDEDIDDGDDRSSWRLRLQLQLIF